MIQTKIDNLRKYPYIQKQCFIMTNNIKEESDFELDLKIIIHQCLFSQNHLPHLETLIIDYTLSIWPRTVLIQDLDRVQRNLSYLRVDSPDIIFDHILNETYLFEKWFNLDFGIDLGDRPTIPESVYLCAKEKFSSLLHAETNFERGFNRPFIVSFTKTENKTYVFIPDGVETICEEELNIIYDLSESLSNETEMSE